MKSFLLVLLAASLAANLVLSVLAWRSTSATSANVLSAQAAATGTAGSSRATATSSGGVPEKMSAGTAVGQDALSGTGWHGARTDQDLHRLVADLRAAGYPASLVRAVVNQLLTERFAPRSPNAGQPFWKRGFPTPEMAAAQTALNSERQALFEALLGPDARPSALLDGDGRERRYGALPDDKIDAIARIERDYNEMSAESWAKRKGNAVASMDTLMQSEQLMEQEKLADLAKVLTPEELAQYEMRNSNAARALFNNLRNVDITDAEYAQLYEAQKAFEAATPRRSTMDQAAYMQRVSAQMALNEAARAVLGESRFYAYVEGADSMYAMAARALNKFPTVTPAASYQVYQLQVELQNQIARNASPQMSPAQAEALRNLVESYNNKLELLVGTAAANAYRNQGMGQVFKSFRSTPRAAGPATK
jgi:hypothetical protein